MSEFDPLTLMMLSGGGGSGAASMPELASINSKKQLMTMLLMRQMGKGGTQTIGNVAIRQSPFSAIGDALAGVMAAKGLGDVDEEQQKLLAPMLELAAAERRAKMQGLQDEDAYRASLKGAPIPGAPVSPTAGMPSLAPTVANADVLAQRQAAPQGGPMDLYGQYLQQSQYWAAQAVATGNPKAMEQAQKFAKAAHDVREKYSGAPIVTIDPVTKQPQYTQFSEFGTQRNQPGAMPPPDTEVVNLGGTSIVRDKRTAVPGTQYEHTMTPGEVASNKVALANYALARENQGKPQVVTDPNSGMVYAVDPRKATGVPITGAGGAPLIDAGGKPLTESQAKAKVYGTQMADATARLAELETSKGFTGKTLQQQSSIANAAGEGIPYVPGSAIVQRWFSSDEAQKYIQAQRQWSESQLRFSSGAVIGPHEIESTRRIYFPMPGDSDALIEQKAASRKSMENAMQLAAGRPQQQVPLIPGDKLPSQFEIDSELRKRGLLK